MAGIPPQDTIPLTLVQTFSLSRSSWEYKPPKSMFSSETTLFGSTTYSVELQRLEKKFLLQCDDDEL